MNEVQDKEGQLFTTSIAVVGFAKFHQTFSWWFRMWQNVHRCITIYPQFLYTLLTTGPVHITFLWYAAENNHSDYAGNLE